MNGKRLKKSAASTGCTGIRVLKRSCRWRRQVLSLIIASIFLLFIAAMQQTSAFDTRLDWRYPVYTKFDPKVTYSSDTYHDDHNMGWLYKIAHKWVWFFTSSTPLPPEYLEFSDLKFRYGSKVHKNDWGALIKQYWRVSLLGTIIIMLAITVPLIGLCCCCMHATACAGEQNLCDKKYDWIKRFLLGLLLLLLTIALLFFVVGAFACNSLMQVASEDSSHAVEVASDDILKFLLITADQVDHVFLDNFHELSVQLLRNYKVATDHITHELETDLKNLLWRVPTLQLFIQKLPLIRRDIKNMKARLKVMQPEFQALYDVIRRFQEELFREYIIENELIYTSNQSYRPFYNDTNRTEAYHKQIDRYILAYNNINADELPDIVNKVDHLDLLILHDMGIAAYRVMTAFDKIRNHSQQSIDEFELQLHAALNVSGMDLRKSAADFRAELMKFYALIKANTDDYAESAETFLLDYSKYRFILGLCVCLVLLLVLLLTVIALCFGCCGQRHRTDSDTVNFCNWAIGGILLGVVAFLIFLTFSAIILIILVHLLLGIVAQRGICMALRDPLNDEVFGGLDNSWDLTYVYVPPTLIKKDMHLMAPMRLSEIIHGCHMNQTLFKMLIRHADYKIVNIIDLDQYPFEKRIFQTIERLVAELDFWDEDMEIFTGETKQRILKSKDDVMLYFDNGRFVDSLFNKVDQNRADYLRRHILFSLQYHLSVPNHTARIWEEELRNRTRVQYLYDLFEDGYRGHKIIKEYFLFYNRTKFLQEKAHALNGPLNLNGQQFLVNIPIIVQEIENAIAFIKQERLQLMQFTKKLRNEFKKAVEQFTKLIHDGLQDNIGNCGPLARAYDACVVAVCNRVVDPLNGFWVVALLSCLLLLPIAFLALALSRLYKKTENYMGPRREAFVVVPRTSSSISILIATQNPPKPEDEEEVASNAKKALFFVVERSIVSDDEEASSED